MGSGLGGLGDLGFKRLGLRRVGDLGFRASGDVGI